MDILAPFQKKTTGSQEADTLKTLVRRFEEIAGFRLSTNPEMASAEQSLVTALLRRLAKSLDDVFRERCVFGGGCFHGRSFAHGVFDGRHCMLSLGFVFPENKKSLHLKGVRDLVVPAF